MSLRLYQDFRAPTWPLPNRINMRNISLQMQEKSISKSEDCIKSERQNFIQAKIAQGKGS